MVEQKKTSDRLAFLDWMRGLGAFIMLQGHSFDSLLKPELRNSGPFVLSQFVGGIAPAIFLFLTGITFAFLMDSQSKQQPSSSKRVLRALSRSGYLFLLAFLFRLQLFSFGYPNTATTDLAKVDILNCMGLAMAIFAPMAVFTTKERVRLCGILGILVAVLSPLVSMAGGDSLPWLMKAYFVPNFNGFAFFPWAAFLAFGMAAGSILRVTGKEELQRTMQWAMLLGILLILGGQYFSNLPYSLYAKSDFWLDSPGLTVIKLGVLLTIAAIAYLWVTTAGSRWSLFRQLGRTSLLVYWVHIELVYGRWFGAWKGQFVILQAVTFAVVLIITMTGLSMLRTNWPSVRAFFNPGPLPAPERVSGD